jgi:tRNA threonylcarbamoyladenosine biosynthesis protein TsaE
VAETTLESRSASDTERLAGAVALGLRSGDVVLVAGDVGTGKTTFVRGACRALGVQGTVASPSFTIGRLYEGDVPVAHLDLFRLDSLEQEDPALLADYLSGETIAFVEWPEAAAPELEPDRVVLRVRLSHEGGNRRLVRAQGARDLLQRLEQALADGAVR